MAKVRNLPGADTRHPLLRTCNTNISDVHYEAGLILKL